MTTQFEIDLKQIGNKTNLGIYNLLTTKRDMHLYCVGIKPNRNFKITDVKKYFGLKGNKFEVNAQIINLVNRWKCGEITESAENKN